MAERGQPGRRAVADIRAAVEQFCGQLQHVAGENLVAIILYGGLAKGDLVPARSDVNLMVVLRRLAVAELDAVAPLIRAGTRDFALAPLVLTERDLRRSTDVFPVRFLDMQRRYEVLRGADVLAGLAIAPDHLRLRIEQQLKNLLLKLRLFYVRRAPHPEALERTLTGAVSALINTLGMLLVLQTGAAPAAKREAADAAARAFGLDGALLQKLLALKEQRCEPDAAELRELYDAFMTLVEGAADVVDSL